MNIWLAVSALLLCLNSPAFSLESIRIATSSPSVGSFPYFLAARKGFYKNEGFEAEIVFVRANIAITALVTNEVDFITFFGSTLRASLRGLAVKNVMVVMSGTDHFLVSRPDIRDLNSLKGGKIAASSPGATVEQEVRAALKAAGLRPGTDVSILYLGGQEVRMAALESRAVHATVLDSVRTVLMTQRGFNSLLNLGDVAQAPFMGIGASREKTMKNPDQVRRMIRGTVKSVRYIKDNPVEAQKALAQLLGLREIEVDSTDL